MNTMVQDSVSLDIPAKVARFQAHLVTVTEAFNEAARVERLCIRMSAETTDAKPNIRRVLSFTDAEDDSGMLHVEQIETAVQAIAKIIEQPRSAGLILGAMQSGKTTTSLALQFAGPAFYLATGTPLFPFYLLTVHTSQRHQTVLELNRFMDFYKELAFRRDDASPASSTTLDPRFVYAPTLETYREIVLHKAFDDTLAGSASPEEFVARRTRGKNVARIAARIRAISDCGFVPLMIIDEPQFGVIDRIEVDQNTGSETRRPSVFKQIFQEIEAKLGVEPGKHVFVATSATPYELNDLSGLWHVNQRLGSGYVGFNIFGGEIIDEGVITTPPKVLGFSDFAEDVAEPFFSKISMMAMDDPERFNKLAEKIDFHGTFEEYRATCVGALSSALKKLAQRNADGPFGICLRGKNSNEFARSLASDLRLGDVFDVLHYNGIEATGKSVKRIVSERPNKDRPFLLFVTNRARMGDAFPGSVRYFIEFSNRFTDMNAMFQGLLGRACGYNKRSTVILSDWNAALVRDIVNAKGGYIYPTSRGSMVVGSRKRGRPTVVATLRRDSGDDLVERFFARVDDEIVRVRLPEQSRSVRSVRKNRERFAPMLRIAADLALFEHIESNEARAKLFPGYPRFKIARAQDTVPNPASLTERLSYRFDEHGDNVVTLRELKPQTHGGVRARGSSGGDTDEERGKQNWLEPQILVRKHDAATGEVIEDWSSDRRREGIWRAAAIVLPLVAPVQELVAGDAAFPKPNTVFEPYLSEGEHADRKTTLDRIGKPKD